MTSYSEKFSAIHHQYHSSKMKKLSIGTEGFFDFFKKKKKEEPVKEKEKSIEDFVNLFNEEFSVVEKKINESEKTEWAIDSRFIGKAKSAQELIDSAKAHVSFLKEMVRAMEQVIKGIHASNEFTKIWIKDSEWGSEISRGLNNILKLKVTASEFRSLKKSAVTEGNVTLTDKYFSFVLVLDVLDSPTKVDYCDISVMRGSFKFNKEATEKITLDKSQFISFMKELKNINDQLSVIYKDYLYHKTDKFSAVISEAYKLYEGVEETHDTDTYFDEAYGVFENYHQGHYTRLCSEAVDEYVKYIHSFLGPESKA